jgi:hypothetical protein
VSAPQRPDSVFLLGCGRSGTTLAYNILASHESFAWISNWTDRSGLAQLATFNDTFRRTRRGELRYRRGMPQPSEGYRLWNRALAVRLDSGVLDESDVTADRTRRSRRLADQHRRHGHAEIFLNKNTRNARMVGLFGAVFPEARFVHVLRSPLDVVSSLLEVAWWQDLPLWTHDGATPRQLANGPEDEALLAAELWCRESSAAREAGRRLGDRYLELRYEDLLQDPGGESRRLLAWCDVEPTPGFDRALDQLAIRRRVDTHLERLTAGQQEVAWQEMRDVAATFDYGRTVGGPTPGLTDDDTLTGT